MTPYIKPIIAAVSLATAFAAGWSWNGSRHDAQIATIRQEQAQAQAEFTAQARAKEQSLTNQINEARNAAAKRETILRADADRARTQSERLRSDIAAIRLQLPELTREAINRYADTASVVFDECQRNYQSLADQADRIDSDRQTLDDAWPR